MKLQQLRYLCEVARRGLSVSAAAEALFTSQPGVSKQIKGLEQELGIDIFVRNGKRLVSITEPGRAVIAIAERMLADAANLKRAGAGAVPGLRRRSRAPRRVRGADLRHRRRALLGPGPARFSRPGARPIASVDLLILLDLVYSKE